MTRDESLEATALVQHTGVLVASLGLARAAHAALVQVIPALKPPVAPGQLLPLVLVFVPLWVFAAERVGVHRLEALTGPADGGRAPDPADAGLGGRWPRR